MTESVDKSADRECWCVYEVIGIEIEGDEEETELEENEGEDEEEEESRDMWDAQTHSCFNHPIMRLGPQ